MDLIYKLNMGIVQLMKSRNTNKKRIFMSISEDLHRKVKVAAALEGRSLQDYVTEYLTEHFNRMPDIRVDTSSPDS